MSVPHERIALALENRGGGDDLVFKAPWMARAFGLTLALSEAGTFTMQDFQAALIQAVGDREKVSCIEDEETYYSCWIEALSGLLGERGLLGEERVVALEAVLLAEATARRDHQHHHVPRNPDGSVKIAPVTRG